MDYSDIHSIVVRCPNWIGDAVMGSSTFQDLKTLFPSAKIIALAHTPIIELLQGVSGIDEYWAFSRQKEYRRKEIGRIIQQLQDQKPDLGVLLTRSFSSAWMFWRGKIPLRLGYRDHGRSCLINIPVQLPSFEQHDVLTYRDLLRPLGSLISPPAVSLHVTEEEHEEMRSFLRNQGVPEGRKILLLNPGAAYGSAKCWPKESFLRVAQEMAAKKKIVPIFIGSGESAAWISEMLINTSIHNFSGMTTLRQLMALISLSSCLVTNDSGPMHIAAALETPLLAIFGSTNPFRTGPWKSGRVLYHQQPCSPCYLRTCPKDFQCMRAITPEEVIGNLQEML
jgi:heptosyltransferase-2